MLVLSRQRDETIMIGDDIEITIVDIRGEKVRLGINAPPQVPVHRKEVYDAIKREKQAAADAQNGGEPVEVHVDSLAQRKHRNNPATPPTQVDRPD
ncbi:MAG TPA: carbon storage regulator CsrA [Phycisphaerae bacterium]|nr:carbon storage regulator CsrA [Phycisphaerae bacterium]